MKVVRDNLWLCPDCTIYAANGDTSGIDGEAREKKVVAGVNRLGPHLVPDFDSDAGEGVEEFATKRCAGCGFNGGGSWTRFAVLGS
jgi:hypothetical protein